MFDVIFLIPSACCFIALLLILRRHYRPIPFRRTSRRTATIQGAATLQTGRRIRPKPPWVREEIIRLKALMPEAGCRKVAITFNLLHKNRRNMTVGKSFVAEAVRKSQAEIREKRRELKHRVPRSLPKNVVWGLDLTTLDDRPVLGVIDHGSRACLELAMLPDKTTLTILRSLIALIERFGRPKCIRTDNEGMFASSLFWLVLRMLGVRHQKTQPKAPWQNGRIERFFGTLKSAIRLRNDRRMEPEDLDEFRAWYNHARPHQHLEGRTPAIAWDPKCRQANDPRFFSVWEGLLTGFVQ